MVKTALAGLLRALKKGHRHTEPAPITNALEAEIFRTVDTEEERLENWYRQEVMPVLYEHASPTLLELDYY